MATTTTPSPPTAASVQAAQSGIVALLAEQIAQAFDLIDPTDLATTLPQFQVTVTALVRRYGSASGALAARHYATERLAAGVTGRFAAPIAPLPNHDEVVAQMGYATSGLWGANPDTAGSKTLAQKVASRMVLGVARATTIDAVATDPRAIGWVREAGDDDPCAFCAMMIARGVEHPYRSKTSALTRSKAPGEKWHNGCECIAVPVFSRDYQSAGAAKYSALWDSSTARKSGRAARIAFRQAVEGRTPAGK